MIQFTKIEDLFTDFKDDQSIGGHPTEGGTGNEFVRIFQPDRGLDVVIKNINYSLKQEDDFSTFVSASFDGRQELGTTTLNNRDYWENLNFNSNNFQPYLTDDRIIFQTTFIQQDGNNESIVNSERRLQSVTNQFSIDAVPFVINPNTDEIIRLDRYYDKNIDSEKYELTTEGKINYYIIPRVSGRTDLENIDTYGFKAARTSGGDNKFDVYADTDDADTGYHLFRLDWGDGSELEHTSKTLILESTTLLEHEYEKPGFYTISGVVMSQYENTISGYEKFETNILINPSEDYEVNLLNYDNFATIGGISNDSVLVKSSTNLAGFNPRNFDDTKVSDKTVEKINLLDRLNLFNFFNKINDSLVNKFTEQMQPYIKEINDVPEQTLITEIIIGCTNPNANNYDPNATSDDGSCDFSYVVDWQLADQQSINFTIDFHDTGLAKQSDDINESDYYIQSEINQGVSVNQLNSSDFITLTNSGANELRQLFIRFQSQNNPPDNIIQLSNSSRYNFTMSPILVKDENENLIGGYYTITPDSIPNPNNAGDGTLIFLESSSGDVIDPGGDDEDFVVETNLVAVSSNNWFYYPNNNIDFNQPFTGDYHIHYTQQGTSFAHAGSATVNTSHEIPDNEIIKQQAPPAIEYSIVLHNGVQDIQNGTVATEVRFLASNSAGIPNGYPTSGNYVQDETLVLSTNVSGTNALVEQGNTINVKVRVLGSNLNEFEGWYADENYETILSTNSTLQFTVGEGPYQGNQNNTIHLWAKGASGI